MVKFHFKYRTLEQLEDLHVIKRASEQLHHYIRPEEQEPVENFIQNLRVCTPRPKWYFDVTNFGAERGSDSERWT